MTHSETLQKAIEKAVKNGYKVPPLEREVLTFRLPREYGKNNSITLWTNGWIMSHDFAKSFWGTKEFAFIRGYNEWTSNFDEEDDDTTSLRLQAWQYHLQQLVLEDDPISYLAKFL